MAKKIVPEEKDKPVLDEQTFARLLEAAYVLQEHNRALQKLQQNLELHSDRLSAQVTAAPIPPISEDQTPIETSSPLPPAAQPVSVESACVESASAEPPFLEPAALEPASRDNYTFTLAQVVETQHQIQARHLEMDNAMSLVAARVIEIAKAGGAAIGFLEGNKVRYRGVAGIMTLPAGTEVPRERALCVACLKTGQILRCADVNPEFLLDPDECRRRGIQAMIAVPVFHDGGVAGALELYYARTQAFTEQDVHSCQLMAGLITEALAREEEHSTKKSLASERALMLEALEKLKPNLAALVGSAAKDSSVRIPGRKTASSASTYVCRKCGHHLVGEEQFCGKCGSPRSADRSSSEYEPPSMQSKVASLWHMQEAIKKSAASAPADGDMVRTEPPARSDPSRPEKPLADSIEEEMPELFAAPELRIGRISDSEEFLVPPAGEPTGLPAKPDLVVSDRTIPDLSVPMKMEIVREDHAENESEKESKNESERVEIPAAITALAKTEPAANWSSATSAREFLEQLAGSNRPGALATFWRARRGDIYLAIAVILVAAVIRWGIWSNHSVSATGTPPTAAAAHRKPAPDADLSLFDRMLISLGLAEAPPAPEYRGNPDTQVWVDLHTALYYCPGADLYGKTPKGRFASQRDAQLDQFEPAYRKACD
jgi:GAF domain-containing protein